VKKLAAIGLPVLLILLATPGHAEGPTRLETILPIDSALVLMIEDVPAFLETWPESPLGSVWNDPQVKRFFQPLRERMQLDRWEELTRETTGFPLSEILSKLGGQAAILLHDFETVDSWDEETLVPVALVAVVPDGGEMLEALMGLDLENQRSELEEGVRFEEFEEEFRGETIHIRKRLSEDGERIEEGWGMIDGYAVVAQPKELFLEIVANIKDGGADRTLSRNAAFTQLKKRGSQGDVLLYCDLTPLISLLEASFAEEGSSGEPNPFGVTTDKIFDSLGLRNLEGLYVSARLAKSETVVDAGLLYGDDSGIVKLLAYRPGPVDLPSFVPDGVATAGVSNFSIPQAWQVLRELLNTLGPASGMLDMYLQQFSTSAGFDLEESLIGSLGDHMVSAQFYKQPSEPGETPSLDEMENLLGIALNDRQTLEMALEGLKGMLGPGLELFDEREYLGQTIYVTKDAVLGAAQPEGSPAAQIAYTLTDEYFLMAFGSSAPIESVLSQGDRARGSIWKRKDVRTALGRLPRDAASLMYYDVASLMGAALKSIATVQEFAGSDEEDSEESGQLCDPEALPGAETLGQYFGIGVGAIEKGPGGLFITFRFQGL